MRAIKNATYTGTKCYNKSRSNNFLEQKRINNLDMSTYEYVEGDFPAIKMCIRDRCLGVPTNVAISKAGLSQNSQAAWTVQIGLRVTDNGKTEAMSRRQAILSFLIGKATEKPTM